MSRIGKYPVLVPQGVDVSLDGGVFHARGVQGEQQVVCVGLVDVSVEDRHVHVRPRQTTKQARQIWGTTRALIANAVKGVSVGFKERLELKGVGYRAQVEKNVLKLSLGFSHDVNFPIPEDVKIATEGERGQVIIAVSGSSKQRVGQVASNIRRWRPPEPYKGKGIRYVGERVLRKQGKKK